MKRYQHPRKICLFDVGDDHGLHGNTQPHEGAEQVQWYRLVGRDRPPVRGTIWLQPWCDSCDEGWPRFWCEDDVWGTCELWKKDGAVCRCKSIRYDPIEEEA